VRLRWSWLGRIVLRAAVAASLLAGALTFVIRPLQGRFTGEFEDFDAYYGAGSALNAGGDPYQAFVHQHPNVALTGFDYPPLVAWLCRPLAWMPHQAAATLWLWIGLAATVAGCVLVGVTLLPRSWPRAELALLTSLVFAPGLYNLWHGQMNPVVFLLLALALRAYVQGREVSTGLWLGIAAAIKLAPVVLVLLLLRRRWWRGATTAAAVIAAAFAAGTLLVGSSATSTWIRDVLPVLGRGNGWLYNQSWNGVVNRIADHGVLVVEASDPWLRAISLTLSIASVMAVAWVVRSGYRPSAIRGAEFGAGVVAMLLAGTITWYAHYVSLVIALAAVAALLAWRPAPRRALVVAAAGAVLASGLVAPLLIASADMSGLVAASHRALWWPLLQLSSLPALTAAALLGVLVWSLRSAEDAPVPATAPQQ
jgi:alpha-1,2-mannosyltransferase